MRVHQPQSNLPLTIHLNTLPVATELFACGKALFVFEVGAINPIAPAHVCSLVNGYLYLSRLVS